jgi:hypothetical protein
MCTVGTVGWLAGGECVGGRGSIVAGWGITGQGGENKGRKWMRRSRKSSWECCIRKVMKEKEVRTGIRK